MYPWIVLLHIAGAFMFAMSHGVAMWMLSELPKQRDPRRISALLDLSGASLNGVYVGLLLLLVGGIWAGIDRGWFRFGWIWAAIVVLVAIVLAMYAIATPFYKRLRIAVGIRAAGYPKDAPDPIPLPDAEVLAIAAASPVALLSAVGSAGCWSSSG
ncbi:MAG TPA: hypothetical protein VHM48_08140 [Candidatus Limnocylindrales bacterium]|nr:hypothetical protein [Candidatus Limnocylindrales bacterium]